MIYITQLRQLFGSLLVAIVLFVGVVSPNRLSALAALTPEVSAYEVDQSQAIDDHAMLQEKAQRHTKELKENSDGIKQASQAATESTKNAFERATDNVREKLNLDEPVPQSTKDFLNSVKGE